MGNTKILLENYLRIINQLPEKDRDEILVRISQLLKAKSEQQKTQLSLFGALNDTETAEQWIERIQTARTPGRAIEPL